MVHTVRGLRGGHAASRVLEESEGVFVNVPILLRRMVAGIVKAWGPVLRVKIATSNHAQVGICNITETFPF